MQELQIFSNPNFGDLRTFIEPDGTMLFSGNDVATALGYVKPRGAVERHCKGALKRGVGVQTGTKADGTPSFQTLCMIFIPIGDVCRLAARSQLPGADEFERWIFDDVIPTVMQTGTYSIKPMSPAELQLAQAQLLVDMDKKLSQLESKSQAMESKVNLLSRSPDYWRAEMDERIKQMARAKGIMEKMFRARLYEELERVEAPLDLDNRLTRMRNRARKQGALHRNCAAFTKLDVIAQNKTLQTAFEAIVDEYDMQLTIGGNE